MHYSFVYPGGTARQAAELARAAEQAGWDAFFVWDTVWGLDPWVTLAACAMVTSRIRLGTMITPLSRRRPWNLAGQTATLDQLSGGRLILSVGLGHLPTGFQAFGEVTDRKNRAELLDEGLDILTGLWRGEKLVYEGKHYHLNLRDNDTMSIPAPLPVQQPRIPIWVVGAWPSERSMSRALKYDGLLPNVLSESGAGGEIKPDDLRAMTAWIHERLPEGKPFEIVMEGETPGNDPAKQREAILPFVEAGATWWNEAMWNEPDVLSDMAQEHIRRRVEQGPPRVV